MVRPILRLVRQIKVVNRVIARLILANKQIFFRLSYHWRVYGQVHISFANASFKMLSYCDDSLVDTLFYKRHYIEENDLRVFLAVSQHSKTILDIGANTGIYSILSAKSEASPSVYSFEPNSSNYKRLEKNLQINSLSNVRPFNVAIGSDNKEISFYVPFDDRISETSSANLSFSKSSYQSAFDWKEVKVTQVSIDNFCASNSILGIDLVKIDVEGHEIEVFEGARNTFISSRPVVLCEIFLDHHRKEYFERFLKESNYCAYMIVGNGLLRLDASLIPNKEGLNYLFSPGRTKSLYTSLDDVELATELRNKVD